MPTSSTKKPTMIQPRVIILGPPAKPARKYVVVPPARIEMIEKLIAKLENQPIFRSSSWA
jgi:hypothetical protein